MTILGVAAGIDHALVWADTAVTGSDGPAGHACKLAINPMARAIGVGAGLMSMLRQADRAVLEGESVESILPMVAIALRAAAMRKAGCQRPPMEDWFARNIYVVVAWSPAEDRVVAYEFPPAELFEPRRMALLTVPEVVIPFYGSPLSLDQLRNASRRQADVLRDAGAVVGLLTVASLTADGIVLLAPEDIGTTTMTQHPAESDAALPPTDMGRGQSVDPPMFQILAA